MTNLGEDITPNMSGAQSASAVAGALMLARVLNPDLRLLNQSGRALLRLAHKKQLRRGIHRSTQDLAAAFLDYIDTVNADPKPFRWNKAADDILATIERFCLSTLKRANAQKQVLRASDSEHEERRRGYG